MALWGRSGDHAPPIVRPVPMLARPAPALAYGPQKVAYGCSRGRAIDHQVEARRQLAKRAGEYAAPLAPGGDVGGIRAGRVGA